ncbi:fungal-specific transcription factor domain-containing protein [Mycena capillaripes]|nr:fungal-specific transcription factor domain-containing protein [Mycena capillaripes]
MTPQVKASSSKMNEVNEDSARSVQNAKRRRLQNSCDKCKRKKIRCDSAEMPGNRCTNCINSHSECTHTPKAVETTPSTPPVQNLRTAQELVATILSTSTVYVPSDDASTCHQILVEVAQYARILEEKLAALQPQTFVPITTSNLNSKSSSPKALSEENSRVVEDVEDVEENPPVKDPLMALIPSNNQSGRFYGQSSSVEFIKSTMKHIHGSTSYVVGIQRPEFWTIQPWEKLVIEPPHQVFPENDLMKNLIKIYFEQINPIMGILHFPSFHRSFLDGLHFREPEFGAVVLAVCAMASRHSDDRRVFLEGTNSEHSCGWKWFRQVRPLRASFSPEPSLCQLQLICLSSIYLSGTSTPEECWILAGLGIRFAQGAGAHHRNGYRKMDALTAELYKRVFWVLVVCDVIMSSFKGRPSITQPADFDLDLPLGCDDEYWEMPDAVQPRGKPSAGAFLPVYLQLMQIFGRIQGAVYPVKGQVCPETVIVELDSALNEWVDIIPEHLRWDPNQENQIFLDQSAALYSTYYHAQILIHRPFIPAPGKQDSLSSTHFPSLAICANAARSCGHVLDVQARRGRGLLSNSSVMTALFDCAVVLLVNVWAIFGGRKSRTPEDFTRATADAQNCVRVLRLYERRWRVAGRKCDIISAMLNLGKHTSNAHSLKHPREVEDGPAPSNDPELDLPATTIIDPSKSVAEQIQALERSIQETDHLFSLPLHTEELGRLPVYDSFDYEFTFKSSDIQYPPLESQYDMSDLVDQQPLHGIDPALDSIFASPPVEMPSSEDIQLPPISFDIPSGYGWRDWSAYLANVDGLNHEDF